MSAGCGPASIASMRSSVISWMAGRRPSTRLKVNGLDSIRRNRVCSSASEVNTDRGRLFTVDEHVLVPVRKAVAPVVDADARVGEQLPRHRSWPVISHGVLPSQIRTRESGLASPMLDDLRRRRERTAGVAVHRVLGDVGRNLSR